MCQKTWYPDTLMNSEITNYQFWDSGHYWHLIIWAWQKDGYMNIMSIYYSVICIYRTTPKIYPKFYFCLSKLWTWPELKINSQVGGSMGLWLGLGVIQAIQLLVQYILPFLRRKTQKNETRGNRLKEPIKVSTWNS